MGWQRVEGDEGRRDLSPRWGRELTHQLEAVFGPQFDVLAVGGKDGHRAQLDIVFSHVFSQRCANSWCASGVGPP